MNCHRARHLLFDFFDGMSNEALRAELDRHLGECAGCERFAAEMTRSLALLRRTPVESLDENFNWKVRLAIHRERNSVRSRSQSAGAWMRAWNLRYAFSTGLAFGAVLVVGAVLLGRGDGTQPPADRAASVQPKTETPVSHGSPWPQIVPRPDVLVAEGGESTGAGPAPTGAIDESPSEARIDSLMANDLMRMTPREQTLYIERRMLRLQHLQSRQTSPARP